MGRQKLEILVDYDDRGAPRDLRKLHDAVRDVEHAAPGASKSMGALGGALGMVQSVAGGMLVAGVITRLTGSIADLGRTAMGAVSQAQQLELAISALLTENLMYEKVNKSVTTRVALSDEEQKKLRDLKLDYDQYNRQLQIAQRNFGEYAAAQGEGGIDARKFGLEMQELQNKIADVTGEIGKLEAKDGQLVTTSKSVTEQIRSYKDAAALAEVQSGKLLVEIEKLAITSPFKSSQVAEIARLGVTARLSTEKVMDFTKAFLDYGYAHGLTSENVAFAADQFLQLKKVMKLNEIDLRQLRRLGIDVGRVLEVEMGMSVDEFNEKVGQSPELMDQLFDSFTAYANMVSSGALEKSKFNIGVFFSNIADVMEVGSKNLLKPLVETIMPTLGAALSKAGDFVTSPQFKKVGLGMAVIAREMMQKLRHGFLYGNWDPLIRDFWRWTGKAADMAGGFLIGLTHAVWNWLRGHAPKLLDAMGGWVAAAWEWMTSAMAQAPVKLLEFATAIAQAAPNVYLTLAGWAGKAWGWLTQAADNTATRLNLWLIEISQWAGANWPRFANWISGAWYWLGQVVLHVKDQMPLWIAEIERWAEEHKPTLTAWSEAAYDWLKKGDVTAQQAIDDWIEWVRQQGEEAWKRKPLPAPIIEPPEVPTDPLERRWMALVNRWEWIKDRYQEYYDFVSVYGTKVDTLFQEIILTNFAHLMKSLEQVGVWFAGFGTQAAGTAQQIKTAFEGLPDTLAKIWERIKAIFGGESPADKLNTENILAKMGLVPGGGEAGAWGMGAGILPFGLLPMLNFFNVDLPNAVGKTIMAVQGFLSWLSPGGSGSNSLTGVLGVLEALADFFNLDMAVAVGTVTTSISGFLTWLREGEAYKKLEEIKTNVLAPFTAAWDAIGGAIDKIKEKLQPLSDAFKRFWDALPAPIKPGSPTEFELGLRGVSAALRTVKTDMAGMISPAAMSRISSAYSSLTSLQAAGPFQPTKDLHGGRVSGLGDVPLKLQSLGIMDQLQHEVLGAFMPGFNTANLNIADTIGKSVTEWTAGGAKTYASLTDIARILSAVAANKYKTLPGDAVSALRAAAGEMTRLLGLYRLNDVDRGQFRNRGMEITRGLQTRLERLGLTSLSPLIPILEAWRGEAQRTYIEGPRRMDPQGPSRPDPTKRSRAGSDLALRHETYLSGLGYQAGADFIVPPGYPNDRYGPLWVESGERVKITPRGEGGGDQYHLNIYTSAKSEPIIADFQMMRAAARGRK